MNTLYLDLASNTGGLIACVNETTVNAQAVDHRIRDDQLVPHLTSALANAGWSYEHITHVACVTGPGGFTSLRMAVATANTIAQEKHIPATGVHLSDLYKARCANLDVLWFHSTKAQALFVRGFGVYEQLWAEPTFIALEDLVALVPENAQWMGELLPAHEQALAASHIAHASLKPVEEVLPSFLASRTYGKELLQPWYGRGW